MTYLDPSNRSFVESLKGPPLYEKSFKDARQVLEDIQNFKPASDVKQERVNVDVDGSPVETVIFRPAGSQGVLKMVFYTHGGGWILGRFVNSRTNAKVWPQLTQS